LSDASDTPVKVMAVKSAADRAVPAAVATPSFPVVTVAGTVAVSVVALVTVKLEAGTPLKVTDWTLTRLVPVIVITSPSLPLIGEKPVIVGGGTGIVIVLVAGVRNGALAVTVTLPGAVAVNGTSALVSPSGITTDGWMVTWPVPLVVSVTVSPPGPEATAERP
jgi:hypothetical protein